MTSERERKRSVNEPRCSKQRKRKKKKKRKEKDSLGVNALMARLIEPWSDSTLRLAAS
jgi:hypothetical protein